MLGVADHPEYVIFTSGGTEANNMAIRSAVASARPAAATNSARSRPHVITSNVEHDSVKLVLEALVAEGAIELSVVNVAQQTGVVNVDAVVAAVRPETVLVTIMLANNEVGTIQPIAAISAAMQELSNARPADHPRILVHTDAAQAIGKIPVNVRELGVDYLTIVGHKFYAPRNGALFVNNPRGYTPLHPLLQGGGQEDKFRPGTENTAMIAGLGAACELVTAHLADYAANMLATRNYFEEKMLQRFSKHRFQVNGPTFLGARLPNTCNFSLIGQGLIGSHVLAACKTFYASVGAACHAEHTMRPSPILLAIGVNPENAVNAIRVSTGRDTTFAELDTVVEELYNVAMALCNSAGVAH
ncbi:selenocysteine lyase, variant 1 [Capsaspora owczarzaki ATCC 30864]|nr:selenocysteine lyase, variant 1 [Capsaspora owczarzaki ATCC 30864]